MTSPSKSRIPYKVVPYKVVESWYLLSHNAALATITVKSKYCSATRIRNNNICMLNFKRMVQCFSLFGKLFQTDGAKKEIQCWPLLVLLSGWLSFIVEFLVDRLAYARLTEDIFHVKGTFIIKGLNMFAARHHLNLYLTGSQFICLNSVILTWALLSSWRQKHTHLFWRVCNFVLNFLLRLGYQTEHA